MKTRIKHTVILSYVFFMFCFASCNNLFQKPNVNKEYGYISLGNTACARSSVVPQSDEELLSKLTNVNLMCVWTSPGAEPVVSYVSGDTWTEFIEQFADPGYPLQTGTYSFTLAATLDQFGTGSGVSFQAIKNDNITAGTTKTLNFTLTPTTNGTPGGINITWNITGTPASATITLSGSDPVNITSFPDNKLTYTKSSLAAGEYDLTVDFKSSNAALPILSTWSGKVRVAAGITTIKEINWTVDATTYTITWNLNDGTITDATYVQAGTYIRKSDTITLPASSVMSRVGYTFDGWYDNPSFSGDPITSIPHNSSGDKSINAKWTKEVYTITFVSNGGSAVSDQSIPYEEYVVEPSPAPEKTNFTFAGWYTSEDGGITLSENPFDFSTQVSSNITLYAKWNVVVPTGFVFVKGATVEGAIEGSPQFVSGSSKTIVDMLVSDHEVTQGEYETYCMYGQASTYAPSTTNGKGENYAVYGTNWYDAIVYCNLRSRAENLTPVYAISDETDPTKWSGIQSDDADNPTVYCGPDSSNTAWDNVTVNSLADGYRLPTSAEWEYAARNGNNGIPEPYYDYAFSSSSDTLDDIAWYSENSDSKVHEVKTDKTSGKDSANALGIYDMCGNVNEWCWDLYSGMRRLRGGSCSSSTSTDQLKLSYQGSNNPFQRIGKGGGFRVVRTVFE